MPPTRRRRRLHAIPRRRLWTLLAPALLALTLGACGKGRGTVSGPAEQVAPLAPTGAVGVATRNTTRLGGADAATDAASVARTVYPGLTPATRPQLAVVVDETDWQASLAAASLAGA